MNLRACALDALILTDPAEKCAAVAALQAQVLTYTNPEAVPWCPAWVGTPTQAIPGRPAVPQLVPPRDVPRRRLDSSAGQAALLHALTHIEFNAINLALDAVWRFPNLPPAYYADWLRVAAEEAVHFQLLNQHLAAVYQSSYGAFTAHDSLWEMTAKTQADPLARMALVPRTLEARGLDATPALREKLFHAGDKPGAAILEIILRDEIGHVAVGNRWYYFLCEQQGREPMQTFRDLQKTYAAPALRPPFNVAARLAAGFTEAEIQSFYLPAE